MKVKPYLEWWNEQDEQDEDSFSHYLKALEAETKDLDKWGQYAYSELDLSIKDKIRLFNLAHYQEYTVTNYMLSQVVRGDVELSYKHMLVYRKAVNRLRTDEDREIWWRLAPEEIKQELALKTPKILAVTEAIV